jgi:hypothetical protein
VSVDRAVYARRRHGSRERHRKPLPKRLGLDDADDQSAIEGVNLVLRVEGSTVTPYAGTLTQTVINGARTDVSPNCGQSVIITSFKERPQIANDTVLQIKQRNVPYDSSTLDISRVTTVIADSEARPSWSSGWAQRRPTSTRVCCRMSDSPRTRRPFVVGRPRSVHSCAFT